MDGKVVFSAKMIALIKNRHRKKLFCNLRCLFHFAFALPRYFEIASLCGVGTEGRPLFLKKPLEKIEHLLYIKFERKFQRTDVSIFTEDGQKSPFYGTEKPVESIPFRRDQEGSTMETIYYSIDAKRLSVCA